MRTIWHSLVWKEWHEHKWKLVAVLAVVWGVFLLISRRDILGASLVAMTLCMAPIAVFVGLGTASGERSRGTLPFLQALPVPMWLVALHKLAFGLVSVIVPIILTTTLIATWYGFLDLLDVDLSNTMRMAKQLAPHSFSGHWFLDSVILAASVAVSFYIWAAAAGVNRRDEVSAGAVALAVMLGWWLLLMFVAFLLFSENGLRLDPDRLGWLTAIGLSTGPGGLAMVSDSPGSPWPGRSYVAIGLFSAAGMHAALCVGYLVRFGRIAAVDIRSPKPAERTAGATDWLPPPRRSTAVALAWKQFRESGPIALIGLCGAVAIAAIVAAAGYLTDDRANGTVQYATGLLLLTGFFAAMYLGGISTLVVGIGLFLRDLEPRLHTFWRSRPISPDASYWIKFGTGLAVVLIAFQLPISIIPAIVPAGYLGGDFESSKDLWDAQLISLSIFLAVYGAAVAATCLVRHAVYAAILSVGALWAGPMLIVFSIVFAFRLLHRDLPDHYFDNLESGPLWITGLLFVAVAGAILGWLAVRYDWGRKSRY